MFEKVIEILSRFTETDISEITMDSKLVLDLGLNSFDVVNVVTSFEDEFDIEIPNEDIKGLKTVEDVVKYIDGLIDNS